MKKLLKIKGACAVTALWYVAKLKDEDAILRLCTAHGFVPSEGMCDKDWQKVAEVLGIKMRATFNEPLKLRKFTKQYSIGLYFVGTFDHLFVVDNGVIFDPRCKKPPGLDRIIKQAWKVI